jgi:hypothetical protein
MNTVHNLRLLEREARVCREYLLVDFDQLAGDVSLVQALVCLVAVTTTECKVVVACLTTRTLFLHPQHVDRRHCSLLFFLARTSVSSEYDNNACGLYARTELMLCMRLHTLSSSSSDGTGRAITEKGTLCTSWMWSEWMLCTVLMSVVVISGVVVIVMPPAHRSEFLFAHVPLGSSRSTHE